MSDPIIFNCSGSILSNKAASAANLPHQWRNQMIRFNIRSGVGVTYLVCGADLRRRADARRLGQ